MTAAIFGLLGVIVGGILNGIAQWALDRRREVAAGRAAARLVAEELGEARSLLHTTIQTATWMDDPSRVLTGTLWKEHRAALAAAPGFAWGAVADAAQYLIDIETRARTARVHMGSKLGEGSMSGEYLALAVMLLDIADEALSAFAKTPIYTSEKVADLQRALNEFQEANTETEYLPIDHDPIAREGKMKQDQQRKQKRRR